MLPTAENHASENNCSPSPTRDLGVSAANVVDRYIRLLKCHQSCQNTMHEPMNRLTSLPCQSAIAKTPRSPFAGRMWREYDVVYSSNVKCRSDSTRRSLLRQDRWRFNSPLSWHGREYRIKHTASKELFVSTTDVVITQPQPNRDNPAFPADWRKRP